MREIEVVSEPAPMLVIQVVKISAWVIFSGSWMDIFRSFWRNESVLSFDFSLALALSVTLFCVSLICCAVKEARCAMPGPGRSARTLERIGCNSA